MKFLSLCSGIEAASVAFAPLGWKAIGFSEIEPSPCAVLAHHYPSVQNFGDMTKFREWPEWVFADADIIVGGPPCQAFSVAGLRNGLNDYRGNITLVYVDLINHADSIRRKYGRPPVVALYENVPGLLSDKTGAFGCLLGGLAGEDGELIAPGGKWKDAGCVFGPERAMAWRVTDAQYFGVPQRRRRVFVVASAREGFDPAEVLFEFDGVRRDTAPSREAREEVAGTISSRTTGDGGLGTDFECAGGLQPWPADIAMTFDRQSSGEYGTAPVASTMSARDFKSPSDLVLTPTIGGGFVDAPVALSVALRGREGGATAELGDEIAGCLRASSGGDKPHVLAPIAFDSRQDPVSSTELFGALGSSSPQAQAVAYAIQAGALRTNPNSGPDGVGVQADHAYTLEARAEVHAVAYSTKLHNTKSNGAGKLYEEYTASLDANSPPPALLHPMAVRRLTTIECARLQGFPDDYLTQVMVRGKPMADGPMYKALGNSWAVPNVRWIGQRIDACLRSLSGSITAPQ